MTEPETPALAACLRWFGTPWGAMANAPSLRVAVPVGALCVGCLGPVGPADCGVRVPHPGRPTASHWHLACLLRVLGGGQDTDWLRGT